MDEVGCQFFLVAIPKLPNFMFVKLVKLTHVAASAGNKVWSVTGSNYRPFRRSPDFRFRLYLANL
jgi:hypothetical protein